MAELEGKICKKLCENSPSVRTKGPQMTLLETLMICILVIQEFSL